MKKRSKKEWKEIKTNMAMFVVMVVSFELILIQGIITATTLN